MSKYRISKNYGISAIVYMTNEETKTETCLGIATNEMVNILAEHTAKEMTHDDLIEFRRNRWENDITIQQALEFSKLTLPKKKRGATTASTSDEYEQKQVDAFDVLFGKAEFKNKEVV